VLAREKLADCTFEGLHIDSCKDDEAKHYASIYFVDGRDYITINLLLSGATTETTKLSITKEQYKRFPGLKPRALCICAYGTFRGSSGF